MKTPSRVTRSRAQVQAAYDQMSRFYSTLAASEAPVRRRALDMLAVQPGEWVLEIGFGPGELLVKMAQRGAWASGIDLSPGMARAAQQRLERAGCAGRVKLQIGDAAHLPYATGSYHAALMAFTLELFDTPEIPRVLAEARRVLRPAGRLAVAAMAQAENSSAMERAYEWFHARFPQWADCRPIPLAPLLAEAGFEQEEGWRGAVWGLGVEVGVFAPML